MKNVILFFVLFLLPITVSAQSGTEGELTWTLSGGVLTISGEGEIPDYVVTGNVTTLLSWGRYDDNIHTVIIEDGVTRIGNGAFYLCRALTSITIPESVTSIGKRAFEHCSALPSITLPGSLTRIEEGTFVQARALTSVNIPESVTSIGSSAFYGCTKLASITLPDGLMSIGSQAFMECGLTSVTIPGSVASMGSYAFARSDLTSVTILDGVTSIGESAFLTCWHLTSITIPESVTNIGGSAFIYCRSLRTFEVPRNVKTIGSGAFAACDSLTSITVEEGNTSFSSEDGILFNYSKKDLVQYPAGKPGAHYSIPDGVTALRGSAFYGCNYLTSVTLPNGVTSIGAWAFYRDSLTSIHIPGSVTSFGYRIFRMCTGLKDVTVEWATPFPLDEELALFEDVPVSSVTLHVPVGTKALYEAAPVWRDFGTIVEDGGASGLHPATPDTYVHCSQGILTVNSPAAEQISIYSLQGSLLYRAQKNTGAAAFRIAHLPKGVLIVTGESWRKKTVVSD